MTYIARMIDVPAHNHNLSGSEERFRVLGGREREVSERANGDDADGIRVVFAEEAEDLGMA